MPRICLPPKKQAVFSLPGVSLSHRERRIWVFALPRFLAKPPQRPSCLPRLDGSESAWGPQEGHLCSEQLELHSQVHMELQDKGIPGKHELLNPAVWITWRAASLCQFSVMSEPHSSNVPASERHFKAKDQRRAGHAALSCCQ